MGPVLSWGRLVVDVGAIETTRRSHLICLVWGSPSVRCILISLETVMRRRRDLAGGAVRGGVDAAVCSAEPSTLNDQI